MPTIYLYSEILPGEAARVVAELAADRGPVEVRINSPGGSVAEGLAIFNALKPRQPLVYVDGIAASIASLIAMAGARISMADNALMMMHWPWTVAEGNASAMRKTADTLDQFGKAMLGAYARAGLDVQTLTAMLDAETWLDTAEAIRLGFADESTAALAIAASFDLSKFRHAPKEYIMNMHNAAAQPPAPAPSNPDQNTPPPNAPDKNAPGLPTVSAATAQTIQELHDLIAAALESTSSGGNQAAVRQATIAALRNPSPAAGINQFRAVWMAESGRGAEPAGTFMHHRREEPGSDFCAAAADALAIRAGARIAKPHAGAADLRGTSVADIARACLSRAGQAHGNLSRADLIRAALSTSDFPGILSNSLGKMLRAGYESEPASHRAWVKKTNVPDFKEQTRVILGSMPSLEKVPESAEYTSGNFDEDRSLPFAVESYGRIITLTRQALINDDLGAFNTIVRNAGQAAARAEADLVYSMLVDNAGAGQTMQDTKPLFHSTHANLATAQSAFDAAALGVARTMLRRQTATGGGILNLQPKFLIVPPELEQTAEVLLAASAQRVNQGADQALVAPWLASLTLVTEPRLATGAFYLVAGSDQIDTYELAMLEGHDGPTVDENDEFTSAAHGYRITHDIGGRFLDWRGMAKVPLV
jgi:ATP-dependent protease ClpP protease subunit